MMHKSCTMWTLTTRHTRATATLWLGVHIRLVTKVRAFKALHDITILGPLHVRALRGTSRTRYRAVLGGVTAWSASTTTTKTSTLG